ncbi:MAG TPA: glycoside hydrolase family 25 protein [Allosphingosinicella sp.]|jgi:GH25 family lysozyme M1 (1,4-beta-N-acetylmuramidase)
MKSSALAAIGGAVISSFILGAAASAQSRHDRAWKLPDRVIVLDPYQGNRVNWDQVATDPHVKAVIHRAFYGLRQDSAFVDQAAKARAKGLLIGAYLLGRPGDPIAQADALIDLGKRTNVKFLALDIENVDPARSMTLADALKFIARVHERTGRYPAFYTNWSTYQHISKTYDSKSLFARTPLWIARFRDQLGEQSPRVWRDYSLWQFSSEINCTAERPCPYRVPGTARDMDVNVFNGSEAALKALFE